MTRLQRRRTPRRRFESQISDRRIKVTTVMPLYEFVCHDCRLEQEILVRGDETPVCEKCGGGRLTKLLSVASAHSAGSGKPGGDLPPAGPCGASCGCFPH